MTTPQTAQESQIDLCRSLLWGTLSLSFNPPSEELVFTLKEPATRRPLIAAAFHVQEESREHSGPVASLLESDPIDVYQTARSWEETFSSLNLESLQSLHTRLFGHVVRGLVCPYEAEYGQPGLFQQSTQLSSLTGFYETFGLQIRGQDRERPDHIGCELEFLEFLYRKEAYARQNSDQTMEEVTARAIRLFLKDHLGSFGRAFGRLLSSHDRDGFLGRAGDLLFDYLTLESRRLGIQVGPSELSVSPVAEDRVPMACAGDSSLVQLEG
jgi:TorA maturation chaperone TorD